MYSLAESLPTSIDLYGVVYDIDMSFNNVILIYDVLNDDRLNGEGQIKTCINLLFDQELDLPIEEQLNVFETIFKKYIAFDAVDNTQYDIAGNPMPSVKSKNDEEVNMDLKLDSIYIYSSFMKDYNIDLFEQQGKLHWWKFKSLLDGLSDETKYKKVIEIRSMDLPKDPKQREQVRKLKGIYNLKKDGEKNGEW